jgi:hypothetical protein
MRVLRYLLALAWIAVVQAYCDDGMYASSYSSYSQSCRYPSTKQELISLPNSERYSGLAPTSLRTRDMMGHHMMEMIVLGAAIVDIMSVQVDTVARNLPIRHIMARQVPQVPQVLQVASFLDLAEVLI